MPTPLEIYNKKVKKREKEKRKKARIEVRTSKKLLEEPEKLKKELDELTHKAIIGRIDPESLERKEKIEKLWEQYIKSKKAAENEALGSPTEKSEESDTSNESDYSSESDDGPKCVIEIKGENKKEKEQKKRRGFHDPEPNEDFNLELKSRISKFDVKETEEEKKDDKEQPKFNYTPRPPSNMMSSNVPYTLNPPPPPPLLPQYPMGRNFMNFVPQPPPMMMNVPSNYQVMKQPVTHQEVQEVEEKKEKVPLSKYFVPSQVRLNRKNPDNKIMCMWCPT